MQIPKRIIQKGRGRGDTPLHRAVEANLRSLNPDYEYLFFDNDSADAFVSVNFPEHLPLMRSFPEQIQKWDFFRYLAVLHYGGFYFDTDFLLSEPLDDLLNLGCVFTFEKIAINRFLLERFGLTWELANYAFGASPQHPFLAAIVSNCVRASKDAAWVNDMVSKLPWIFQKEARVLCSTGPGLVTRTYAEDPLLANTVHVLSPGKIYDNTSWFQFGSKGVHLMESSWRKKKSLPVRLIWRVLCQRLEERHSRLAMASNPQGNPIRDGSLKAHKGY